jgi:hypothetical protein
MNILQSLTKLHMGKIPLFAAFFLFFAACAWAQDFRWQQRVEYTMDVKLDVGTHRISGTQKLTYFNNSTDTLSKVVYHLYFNAFQPGSMMDVRSANIPDPDPRVMDRISKLSESEIGYQHIKTLQQDGKDVSFNVMGTILEVVLKKPLLPNSKTLLDMTFEAQVPLQIRRTGWNNKEGIAFSMTQWYPKMAEYDFQGWHAYPYVAREFHGVWGDFDVSITLDSKYMVAGSGLLQNPEKTGHGYEKRGSNVKTSEGDLTWHFIAKNVHDFAWAADPDYRHETAQVPGGPTLHLFYQPGEKTNENWTRLKEFSIRHFEFMNKTFGKYPYETYSIIQGGDGGMEYPMCTLINGEKSFGSLMGTAAHEVAHSWYQGVLANNEALYPWLDEGFADFASNESIASIFSEKNPQADSYNGYFALVKSGLQEPASQHSDHYNTNRAYGTAAYNMGTVFLEQLKYIIGEQNFYTGMRRYYNTWKFKHPEPIDFIRIMEKVSGMQLKWYLNYFISTTKTVDYSVRNIVENEGNTFVTLERKGYLPMPVDLMVTYKDGAKELFYIPLSETLGSKPVEDKNLLRNDLFAWPWVNPNYKVRIGHRTEDIASIEIDPSMRMADTDRTNNKVDLSKGFKAYEDPTK